jgi:hypothetical protein
MSSFADRLILWLHIAFVIFTIGPVTVAIMTTPRYIRARNLVIVRYIYRTTRIFSVAALGVLIFGIILGAKLSLLGKPWLSISMTLFIVALILLVLIIRDQGKAITGLEAAEAAAGGAAALAGAAPATAATAGPGSVTSAAAAGQPDTVQPSVARQVATAERGRIAALGGVVSLIWLVILVLMIWR